MFITHSSRRFFLVGLMVLTLGTVGIAQAAVSAPKTSATKLVAPYTTTQVVTATNNARKDAGLQVLKSNPLLTAAAQQKANDMVSRNYFSHTTPDGDAFWDFILDAGYSYQTAGENLAVSYKTLDGLMDGWMNSPGHKANIMGTQYSDIGIGIAYGERKGKKSWYVVQLFGTSL